MEQNKLNLKLEDCDLLFELLPRFNSIYKRDIEAQYEDESSVILSNIQNVSVNDIFTLGGFYGTALYKSQQKES